MPNAPTASGATRSAIAYDAGVEEVPMSASATYAPSAKSDPCARLITSITPTISMNPSAMSAKRSPSDSPLTTCGARFARSSTYTS
jgi:hypothetical protein